MESSFFGGFGGKPRPKCLSSYLNEFFAVRMIPLKRPQTWRWQKEARVTASPRSGGELYGAGPWTVFPTATLQMRCLDAGILLQQTLGVIRKTPLFKH